MESLLDLLRTEEFIVVYVVIILALLLCLVIYLIDKATYRSKLHKNTRQLKNLVDEVREKMQEETLMPKTSVINNEIPEIKLEEVEIVEEFDKEPENANKVEIIEEENEKLTYTSIEPTKEEAKEELERLTKELIERKEKEKLDQIEIEKEQNPEVIIEEIKEEKQEIEAYNDEEYAPISLNEYIESSSKLHEADKLEISDESYALISIEELQQKYKNQVEEIKEITSDASLKLENYINDIYKHSEEIKKQQELEKVENSVKMHTLSDILKEPVPNLYQKTNFRNSNFISPIYGKEQKHIPTPDELKLENTANYEKLDQEIKKTNEFLAKLKELQQNLNEIE